MKPRAAVVIPCFNEEATVGDVVRAFAGALPDARIFVYDNNSTDDSIAVAAAAGAIVQREPQQGKGSVVRRMFSDIDADVYVMVDADGTYDASVAAEVVQTLHQGGFDLLNVARDAKEQGAYRAGHRVGNAVLTGLVRWIFGLEVRDMLSGYKVFNRRFVKTFPAMSRGFEIETELMVHALELRVPVAEASARYSARPANSASKLRTFRDGFRILRLIGLLVRRERPLLFFGFTALGFAGLSLWTGLPIVQHYFETGLVPRLPLAVLAVGLMLTAVMSLFAGLILETVTESRREIKRLFYLREPARPSQ